MTYRYGWELLRENPPRQTHSIFQNNWHLAYTTGGFLHSLKTSQGTIVDFNSYKNRLVEAITRELYEALCKDAKKYADERRVFSTDIRVLITAIATYLAARLGVASIVISTLTTATIMLMLKVGRGAFCQIYAPKFVKKKAAAVAKRQGATERKRGRVGRWRGNP
jgi:hypothetical protein